MLEKSHYFPRENAEWLFKIYRLWADKNHPATYPDLNNSKFIEWLMSTYNVFWWYDNNGVKISYYYDQDWERFLAENKMPREGFCNTINKFIVGQI